MSFFNIILAIIGLTIVLIVAFGIGISIMVALKINEKIEESKLHPIVQVIVAVSIGLLVIYIVHRVSTIRFYFANDDDD